jgi:DNA-binding transcriptional regulator YiaG
VPAFDGNIKEIRLKLGLSQEEMAYRVGVSLSTLQRWEHHSRRPSRLASKALEVGVVAIGRARVVRPALEGQQMSPKRAPRRQAPGVELSRGDGGTDSFEGDIRQIRLQLGWSRQRLAHEVGVSQSTLHRWEHRRTQPSGLAVRQLERIIRHVRVSPGPGTGARGTGGKVRPAGTPY